MEKKNYYKSEEIEDESNFTEIFNWKYRILIDAVKLKLSEQKYKVQTLISTVPSCKSDITDWENQLGLNNYALNDYDRVEKIIEEQKKMIKKPQQSSQSNTVTSPLPQISENVIKEYNASMSNKELDSIIAATTKNVPTSQILEEIRKDAEEKIDIAINRLNNIVYNAEFFANSRGEVDYEQIKWEMRKNRLPGVPGDDLTEQISHLSTKTHDIGKRKIKKQT